MRTVLAVISVVLQTVYAVGLLYVIEYLVPMFSIDWGRYDADPRMIALEQTQVLIDFGLMTAAGMLWIVFAWFVLRLENFRPTWFVIANRVLALTWFVFFPFGTVIAFFVLKWCKADANSLAAA